MVKLAKTAVDFEHPARGRHHCSQCKHFDAPESCRIVAGTVMARDWCRRFLDKRENRKAKASAHLNRIGSSY